MTAMVQKGKKISKNINTLNLETCDSIFQISQKTYINELERYKQIENKTSIVMILVGVFLTVIVNSFLNAAPTKIENLNITTIFLVLDIVIFIGAILGFFYLLKSLVLINLAEVDVSGIVTPENAVENTAQFKLDMASTYKDIIEYNAQILARKTEDFEIGLIFIKFFLLLFLLKTLLEGGMKYVLL